MKFVGSGIRMLGGAALAAAIIAGATTPFVATPAAAASPCVLFKDAVFDSPGDDNYMPQLNQEWIRIKNYCSTTQKIGGWKIYDRANHVYRFRSGVTIAPGATIKLHSGCGRETASNKYWGGGFGTCYGAIWNNDHDTAYLANSSGRQMDVWAY